MNCPCAEVFGGAKNARNGAPAPPRFAGPVEGTGEVGKDALSDGFRLFFRWVGASFVCPSLVCGVLLGETGFEQDKKVRGNRCVGGSHELFGIGASSSGKKDFLLHGPQGLLLQTIRLVSLLVCLQGQIIDLLLDPVIL